MPPALPPDTLQDLMALRDKLCAAAPKGGERGKLVHEFAHLRGCKPSTVYRWLQDHAGHTTGRKRRSDAGATGCLPSRWNSLPPASSKAPGPTVYPPNPFASP